MKSNPINMLFLFSGGLDSTSLLWDILQNHHCYVDEEDMLTIHPVYCSYGNKNEQKEQQAAKYILKELKGQHTMQIRIEELRIIPIALLNGSITESGGDCSLNGTFAKEYVPFRNATMIFSALSAMTTPELNFKYVMLGTHLSDTHLKFPDCGERFAEAMNQLLAVYNADAPGAFPHVVLPYGTITKEMMMQNHPLPKFLKDLVFSGYTDGKPPAIEASQERKEEWLDPKNYPKPPKVSKEVSEGLQRHFALAEEQPATSLMVKEHEPLIIRKFTQYGFPVYVGLICGANLDNLDSIVHGFLKDKRERVKGASIQTMRNIVGELSGHITEAYGLRIEGVAVVWYVDKMMVSSLYGDFMTHTSCRIEFYSLLQMSCHV